LEADIKIINMEFDFKNIDTNEFSLERKGYKKSEVKDFLLKLAERFGESSTRILNQENEIEDLKTRIEDYEKIEKDLRDALVFLKESERDTLIKTQDQVSTLIKEAEARSEEIVYKAEEEAKSTRDTLIFLKEQREIFVTRLRIIIDNQEGMLNDLKKGDNSAQLHKTMAEAAAFKSDAEMNIDTILEKLL
jgi:cell division initiation protein